MYIVIIVLLALVVAYLEKRLNDLENGKINNNIQIDYKDKFTKKEYLLTPTELKFYRILKQITDELGYSLFCQVSLYEIVKNKQFKDFAKIRYKTIDFVITQENCKILLCIELDDYSHNSSNRIQRDDFLNKLFKDLDIKFLRVPVQSFYNMEELRNKIKESI